MQDFLVSKPDGASYSGYMTWLKNKKIRFIGIGGVGVNALAKYALDKGAFVSGSDAKECSLLRELKDEGIDITIGENPFMVDGADMVVYSSAIRQDNGELLRARELGVKVFERQEFLARVAADFRESAGIAGTHGKTTTTAMLCHIMRASGVPAVGMIGGESVEFSNYTGGDSSEIFITEACEYKRNFLSLNPTVAVVTNEECDHPDSYKNFSEVKEAFDEYLSKAKVKIFGEQSGGSQIIRVRSENEPEITYEARIMKSGCTLFKNSELLGDIVLSDASDYNYKNAAFAIATAAALGVDEKAALSTLPEFKGVKRRFEYGGEIMGVPAYFDFAHHPTEIACVLNRAASFGKILAVFQPHTYSRTKAYFEDFVRVFGENENIGDLILMPTYAAREKYDASCDSGVLASAIELKREKNVFYAAKPEDVLRLARLGAKKHGIVLFIGAGDIYDLKKYI